jgi:biopolymer transport protein ExbB/TolQ
MKTLYKIIIIIVIIFIVIGLYFLLRNKQNFIPQIKFSKKLKDHLLKLKDVEKKKSIIKNDDLQKKIDEIQNKKSAGLFKLKSNN